MRAFWGVVLVMMAGVAQAGALRAVSVVAGPDATRVVLETQARAPYHVFTLDRPDRVVVDLQGLRPSRHLLDGVAGRGVVRAVRESVQKDGLRIVFDVTGPVSANSFVMAPSGAFGNRVIVDLVPKAGTATTMAQATPAPKPVSTAQPVAAPIPSPPIASHSTALTVPVARGPMPSPVLPDPKANPAAAVAAVPMLPTPVAIPPDPGASAPTPPVATAAEMPPPSAVASAPSAAASAAPVAKDSDGSAHGSEAEDAAALAAAAASAAPVRVLRAEPPASAAAHPVARSVEGHAMHGGKPIIVAIDAGHGGYDPGAIGFNGVQEKDVCLAMARRLAALVDAQPGMHAVLTRDGDYFVELRQRMVKARAAQADVFVSIHANSYRERSTHGAAVYVLSAHGATNEQARWLANHENAADLVGGVDLQGRDEKVAAVLLDISQSATMEASFDLAGRMLDSLHEVTDIVKPDVQQAGFMVLKSPDIPSILIETAFITNAEEEHALASEDFEGKMAHAILHGLLGYFDNYRPQSPAPAVQTAQRISSAQQAMPLRSPLKD